MASLTGGKREGFVWWHHTVLWMPDIAAIPLSVSSARPQAYQGFLCFLSAHAHPSCVSVLSVCVCGWVCNWGEEFGMQRSQHGENCNELCRKTDRPLGLISRHKWINLASTHWSTYVYMWNLSKSLKDVLMCSTSWLLYFICTRNLDTIGIGLFFLKAILILLPSYISNLTVQKIPVSYSFCSSDVVLPSFSFACIDMGTKTFTYSAPFCMHVAEGLEFNRFNIFERF